LQLYLAGPLFSNAERECLDKLSARLRSRDSTLRAARELRCARRAHPGGCLPCRRAGLRASNALLAWLDGPVIDDGTAAEIGAFAASASRVCWSVDEAIAALDELERR